MKTKLVIVLVFTAVLVASLSDSVMAYEAWGWDQIREDLIDGDGAEFVKPIPGLGPNEFSATTEMEAVLLASEWVMAHMTWVADPFPPGDVWTASDQQYAEIMASPNQIGTGDCEDFAILLCALLRFHTQGGIPADRVWVKAGIIVLADGWTEDKPPIAGHALVAYKSDRGIYSVEPQWGMIAYRGCKPAILQEYWPPPYHAYFAGESNTLCFNDAWVRGGGFWLAGPRN